MSGAVGSILSNYGALQALNNIASTQSTNNTLETQLASGLSINSPSDNPAGFITAQGFQSQINGITQATSNANEGVSLLQTAQGAVQQQLNVVQKLNSIAVQAANGTQTPQEAQSLQSVVGQLSGQVTTIAQQTQFNNINLLDGSFQGVQFQVGANEGQTLNLSIAGTDSNSIGMNATSGSAAAAGLYGTTGNAGATVSVTGGTAFSSGNLAINGSNGSASVGVTKSESAASIATAVNSLTNQTNVSAQATTSLTVATTGGAGGSYNFTLSNGTAASPTNGVNISATGQAGLITAINNQTTKTGITAVQNSSGNVVLSQAQGQNIAISGVVQGNFTTTDQAANKTYGATTTAGTTTADTGGATLVAQGKVQFQSDAAFSVGNSSKIGLASNSSLTSLSSINVSTVGGANTAINVVKFALQGLNNLGGQLGATQQRLQATLNNLGTTGTNLSNGLATIQDANIPQVSSQLTQSQIQAQAGVAALKSSSQLQQSYLSLLP